MNGDHKEPWLNRILGGIFVVLMRVGAFVWRLVDPPDWMKRKGR